MRFDDWTEYKLSEIVDIFGGGTPKASISEYWGGNIPWLSIKDFNSNNRFVYCTEKSITQLGLKNSSTKLLNKGDLIISARGTVGALAQLGKPMTFNQSCYGLRAKPLTINNFLYYLLKDKIKILKRNTHGSVFDTITRKTFDILKVKLPPLKEQKAIAHILSTLDEKIELNKKINKTLEDIAQAIFKHWFVDFEFPNENGESYKSSGGEMVESELGMIPKGWEIGTVSDMGEVVGGATPSKKKEDYFTQNGIPWITPKDLANTNDLFIERGSIDITEKGLKNSSVRKMPKGTVLFSSRAPIGYIAISKNEITTNQGFKSIVPAKKTGFSSMYVFCWLKENTDIIRNRANGSTFKEISGSEMKKISSIIPPKNILVMFNNIQNDLFKKIETTESENRILKNIRDTLLPKLMSGEIRVPLDQEGDCEEVS